MFTPNTIRVWPDRIEEYEPHAVRKKGTQGISYHQVSEVLMSRGIVWSDLAVESTGGRTIKMIGMPKAEAGRVKKLIDDAVYASRTGRAQTAPTAPQDVADQIRKLAALRDEGLLSEAEFVAQKSKLLS